MNVSVLLKSLCQQLHSVSESVVSFILTAACNNSQKTGNDDLMHWTIEMPNRKF